MNATSLRHVAPDRLEIRSGGGCPSLFGLPFLTAGLFLVLAALQVIPFSNAAELPAWAWPAILLMGFVFATVGGWLVFGRTRVVLDTGAGRVTREQRILVRIKQEEHSLLDYEAVILSFTAGDSDSADRYDVAMQGRPPHVDLPLLSLTEYGPAVRQAAVAAQALRLPLVDITTDHRAIIPAAWAALSLWDRLTAGDERASDRVERPAALQSDVQVRGRSVRIAVSNPPLGRLGLVAFFFPIALLLFFGPRLLRFFGDTGTPAAVQACAFALLLVFFAGLPFLEFVSASLRARRGLTVLTASPAGISIEERGAWRSRTRAIPAEDILGLDYSTPESAAHSPRRAADQFPRRTAAPESYGAHWEEPSDGSSPVRPRWLGRWVKGKGLVLKTTEDLVYFGAGLPGPEIHYLWGLVTQALAGSPGGTT